MDRAQLSTEVDSAAVGQAHVEHRDLNADEIQCECFIQRSRLRDDFEVALGFEEFAKPPANNFVVVDQ
jgi:hypothetical protein